MVLREALAVGDDVAGEIRRAGVGQGAHVFIHRTPDQYERFLEAAKYFLAEKKTNPAVVFLSSWNEWTEDHYLVPDTVHGYGYLEAVRSQFGPVA